MHLLVVGINHKSAPIELLEKVSLAKNEIGSYLTSLRKEYFKECFILSTCNRTEIYGITECQNFNYKLIIEWLTKCKSCSEINAEHFYYFQDNEAVTHLFSVAAGINSLVTGDVQIMGQLRDSVREAKAQQTIGFFMSRLVDSACRTGKRARTETLVSQGASSVSYVAVKLLSEKLGNLQNRSALLIGAGKTGHLTAKHLAAKNIGNLCVANRTLAKAEIIVNELGGKTIPFAELFSQLEMVDIVVTSVESQSHILECTELQKIMQRRLGRPLFIVDLGMPRNVNPHAGSIENINLWDMEYISKVIEYNMQNRLEEIAKVEQIIAEELAEFLSWFHTRQVSPTIQALNGFFEEVRQTEVAKHLHKINASEHELIELITKRIIGKLLHPAMVNLRNEATFKEPSQQELSLLKLFNLNKISEN